MALAALGEIGGGHAQSALEARLVDADPAEREQIGQTLSAIRERTSALTTRHSARAPRARSYRDAVVVSVWERARVNVG